MERKHCDNCDERVAPKMKRAVSFPSGVHPGYFDCVIEVTISTGRYHGLKPADLCEDCLKKALADFCDE